MLRKIRGLHKNESGQSIVFSAITFLFLAMFVFMVLNVGDVTQKKMRLVNNADAVAVSGATWMCRGYNLTAMLNVTQSQVLAIIILMKSFERANKIAKILIQVQKGIAEVLKDIPYTAAVGAVLYAITVPQQYLVEDVGEDIYEELANTLEDDGNGILWTIEDYLVQAEEIEVKVIPFIAQIEAVKTGLANGATIGVLYPLIPLVDLKLPFIDEDDRKFESLCKPTATEFNWRSIPEATKVGKVGNIGMEGQKNIEHMPTTSFMASDKLASWLGAIMDILTFGDFGPAPLEYFKAYLFYPLLRGVPPFVGAVYDGVVRATYESMCTGKPGSYSYKKTTDDCNEIKQHADKLTKLTYYKNGAITLRSSVSSVDEALEKKSCNCGDPSPCKVLSTYTDEHGNERQDCGYFDGKVSGKDAWLESEAASGTLEGDDAKNFFKYVMNKKCEKTERKKVWVNPETYGFNVESEPRLLGNVRAYKLTEIKVISAEYETEEQVSPEEAWGSRGGSDSDKPKPFLLNREDDNGKEYWQTHKDYVGIVYNLPEDNVVKIKAGLDNPNPVGTIYFSQAEIYVPDGVEPHLFNQCWQVRLVRFTKFKELSEKLDSNGVNQALAAADSGGSGAVGKFMKLFKALKEVFSGDVIIH